MTVEGGGEGVTGQRGGGGNLGGTLCKMLAAVAKQGLSELGILFFFSSFAGGDLNRGQGGGGKGRAGRPGACNVYKKWCQCSCGRGWVDSSTSSKHVVQYFHWCTCDPSRHKAEDHTATKQQVATALLSTLTSKVNHCASGLVQSQPGVGDI